MLHTCLANSSKDNTGTKIIVVLTFVFVSYRFCSMRKLANDFFVVLKHCWVVGNIHQYRFRVFPVSLHQEHDSMRLDEHHLQ